MGQDRGVDSKHKSHKVDESAAPPRHLCYFCNGSEVKLQKSRCTRRDANPIEIRIGMMDFNSVNNANQGFH